MSFDLNFSSNKPNLIQNAGNLISSAVDQAIVRPLGMPNLNGVSGMVMDILEDEEILIDSDITDHYVEQNYAIQDHIALKPIRFSLKGYVGEQVDVLPNALASIFTQVTGLVTLGGLAPQFNLQDSQFYAKVNDVAQKGINVIKQARNIFQLFNQSSTTTNKQQTIYQYFFNMWKTRQLCSVETPYAIFENMAIESIRALQAGDTNMISEFVVTFKQIRTVATTTFSGNVGSLLSQNLGSISSLPKLAGGQFEQVVSPPVSLGSDSGKANDHSGRSITVENTSQSMYVQQAGFPNIY